ncbi:antirestriction protein ArdA, partial [Enterococcus hirae]|uniref:antirestriction protein ArdA n=1 Tax=Enterococcus hirae TaxID=1354 RepID=UPI003D7F87D4
MHALQISTESSIRSAQERSKNEVTGKLKAVAYDKIDQQTDAIHDYELPFTVDEYTSIGELNRLWEMVSELPEELQSELSALL